MEKILADLTGAVDFQTFCGDSDILKLLIPSLCLLCCLEQPKLETFSLSLNYIHSSQTELIEKVEHKSVLT